jgi:hypothetical protein
MAAAAQTDLDAKGIAKTARDEKLAARAKAKAQTSADAAHDAQMEQLYRQHILKEQPSKPLIQIQGLKKAGEKTETPANVQ